MADTECVTPHGERLRKAVVWVSEVLREKPERDRREVIREAEVRFDLTPKECRFLDQELPGN